MAKRMKEKTEARAAAKDTRPTAKVKYVRIAPSKVRVVIDNVRGKSVNEAIAILDSTPKAASEVVSKLIKSATANAEHNMDMARADLYVAEIFADGGPILKRVQPVSKGGAYRINKRTSHITVVLDSVKEVR